MKREKSYKIKIFLESLESKDSNKIIQNILNNIKEEPEIGFAGFQSKNLLKSTLERFITSWKEENKYFEIGNEEIKEIINQSRKVLDKLKNFHRDKIHLFIFPCFDKFTIEKMGGIGGFCPWKNVILIFFNPKENWKTSIRETIVHEFAHSISPFYQGGDYSIGEGFIFEGLAEHFRENLIGGKIAPYSKVINEKKIKIIFNELKEKLDSKDWNLYMEVFYGTGKYPCWAGYSIGYYLIEKYLRKNSKVDWNILLRKNPKEILNEVSIFY